MEQPLVSIIMPAFNAGKYIRAAILSVIAQGYQNWELLVINDGSTDKTKDIVLSFPDHRIKYFEQENQGVGAARNVGLEKMQGNFFCFLDADDCLTLRSIEARINLFRTNPEISFVDGIVLIKDSMLQKTIRNFVPSYKGNPRLEIAKLKDSCFFSITWMVRRNGGKDYSFNEKQTHGEDLVFFLDISKEGKYDFVPEPIYIYRSHADSAMSNLDGLKKGYIEILEKIKRERILYGVQLFLVKLKVSRIMAFSFFKQKKILKGIRAFWLFLIKI